MAKLNTFALNTTPLGTGDPGPQPSFDGDLVYTLTVNWNGTEINEGTGRILSVTTSQQRGRDALVSGDKINPNQPGVISIKLDNSDGRYDPYNTSGALYGKLGIDKLARLTVYSKGLGVSRSIIAGKIIKLWSPGRDEGGSKFCDMDIADGLQIAADCDVPSITKYNITVDQAIQETISAIRYPYVMDPEPSAAPVYFFGPTGLNSLDVLNDLAIAGMGNLFCANDGTLKYYDLSTTSQPTHTLDQAVLLKEISMDMPWNLKRNSITVVANRYGTRTQSVIWSLPAPTYIGPRQSWKSIIKFNAPALAIPPVAGDDYDPGFFYSATVGGVAQYPKKFTVTLSGITDTEAIMTVSNADPDLGAYISAIRVRGLEIAQKKVPVTAGGAGVQGNGVRVDVYSESLGILIAAGDTYTKAITFSPECVAISPVSGTDYYNPDLPLVSGGVVYYIKAFTVTLSSVTTSGADLNITNNYDTTQTFGNIRVRGELIQTATVTPGTKQLTVDSDYLQDDNFAAAYSTILLALLNVDAKNPTIIMESRPDAFSIDVGDKITLSASGIGITSETFDVLSVTFDWTAPTGQGYRHVFKLGHLLHSTTAITPHPYQPGPNNPLPPETPPVPTPTELPGTDKCLSVTGGGLETGPLGFAGGVLANDAPTMIYPRVTLRQSNHPKRSYLSVNGLWESLSSGVWSPDATFDFEALQAKDAAGNVTATGSLYTAMVADGVRGYSFNNPTGADADSILMALPAATTQYVRGQFITSTTVPWSPVAAYAQIDLNVGAVYMLETIGGPWWPESRYAEHHYSLDILTSNDVDFCVASAGGYMVGGYNGYTGAYGSYFTPSSFGIQIDNMDGQRSRFVFKALQSSYYVRIPARDVCAYSDARGTIGFNLYAAGLSPDKRITIRTIELRNYCPAR
jgi:hypothetical protein